LPSSFITTGGLGFPVFLFEEARILSFPLQMTSSLTSSFRLCNVLFSVLSSLITEEQKKKPSSNERDEFLFFLINTQQLNTNREIHRNKKDREREKESKTFN